jgi:predicted transcriptional regulator
MPGVKEQVIQMIQALSDNITVEDVMEELYFKLQVDAGLKEPDEGKVISQEEVEKRMSKWLTKLRWSPRATSNLENICEYIA